MLRIAICDDDSKFTRKLETLVLQESQKLGIRADTDVFSDGKTLLKSFQNGDHYELIFIDIEMEQVDGITAARRIREIDRTVLLVYVSGYDKYLKELFEVEPFRFLSKPLNHAQFDRYFKEACKRINETEVFYQFTFNKEIRKISVKDIVYFESNNRIVYIHLKDGTNEYFYGKLNNVEKELAASRQYFLRIHQSFLVNYDYIIKMNFFNITINYARKKMELKISEDRQKEVRRQLCKIAGGKAVIEE
ncbi:MAG: LytTR family DNA-binding domain-containing protein [Lachnospiraceae bacterium]|jgi:DNA-binding LytR/AlgR family response regulator